MPDAPLFRIGWHARVGEYRAAVERRLREIAAERDRDDLSRRTRERLLRISGGLDQQRVAVESLMAPVVESAAQLPSLPRPSNPDPAASLAVLQHYENIFRDWAWGEEENDAQRLLLQKLASSPTPLGRLAVYGAGAGRLAADLHQHLAAAHTFALDANPLPLIVGEQLCRGITVELPEFPVAPRTEAQVVVQHRLTAEAARPGLTFMFADALRPPFAAGSLDLVVTSWFIDAVDADLGITIAAINRVLRPDGRWLNLGPLRFTGSLANQHALEEVLEALPDGGFELEENGSSDVPYFRSPYTGSSRVETVYWYAAHKTGDAAAPESPATVASGEPPWLEDPTQPVPQLPQLAQLHRSSVFTIGVLSMVDGRRSIADIAVKLAQSWNAEPSAVQDHLRAFFGSLFL